MLSPPNIRIQWGSLSEWNGWWWGQYTEHANSITIVTGYGHRYTTGYLCERGFYNLAVQRYGDFLKEVQIPRSLVTQVLKSPNISEVFKSRIWELLKDPLSSP